MSNAAQTTPFTNQDWAAEAVADLRQYYESDAVRDYKDRLSSLKKLKDAIIDMQDEIVAALKQDIGRPEFEAYAEMMLGMEDLNYTIKNLKQWMKPEKVATSIWAKPGNSRIESVPLGVTFIMGPYNYPFVLTMQPLIGAVAAGNTVIIKPSSLTPATSDLLEKMVTRCFDPSHVRVYKGSTEVTNALLEQKFDHIFFTGSPRVGKIVMAAAAKHLTPVTLELGGKSPTIIHKDANLKVAARRLVSGKFLNAGQTCIAPDHVYVHKDIRAEFEKLVVDTVNDFFGENTQQSPDFGRLINDKHHKRVAALIDQDKVLVGGQTDESDKFIAPTILKDVTFDDAVMKEEIFGPVLPMIEYGSVDEVVSMIKQLPEHPLALYLFTNSRAVEDQVLNNTQFGGGCINNTIFHLVNHHMPFGGVGESGMGSYHGKKSFDLFSHKRSILKSSTWLDIKLRYAPYNNAGDLMRKLMR